MNLDCCLFFVVGIMFQERLKKKKKISHLEQEKKKNIQSRNPVSKGRKLYKLCPLAILNNLTNRTTTSIALPSLFHFLRV